MTRNMNKTMPSHEGNMYLTVRPPGDAILSAYLLQYGSTYTKLLGHIVDGQMEVLGESLKADCLSQRHVDEVG